jgi:hypothetical protein
MKSSGKVSTETLANLSPSTIPWKLFWEAIYFLEILLSKLGGYVFMLVLISHQVHPHFIFSFKFHSEGANLMIALSPIFLQHCGSFLLTPTIFTANTASSMAKLSNCKAFDVSDQKSLERPKWPLCLGPFISNLNPKINKVKYHLDMISKVNFADLHIEDSKFARVSTRCRRTQVS